MQIAAMSTSPVAAPPRIALDRSQRIRRANIITLLEREGMSKTAFAQRLNMYPTRLSHLLSGHRPITEKTTFLIEHAFKLSPGSMSSPNGPTRMA